MHCHAEVWIPTNQDVEKHVEAAMAPHNEESSDDGFWDWYQIGGRWKGAHVPGYSQEDDPENKETPCRLCSGTGARTDENVRRWYAESEDKSRFEVRPDGTIATKCNGCDGEGIAMAWPTQWKPHAKDVIPIRELPDDLRPYTLVLPGKVLHTEEYVPSPKGLGELRQTPSGTLKHVLEGEGIKEGYLVTVDYHG